MIQLPLSVMFKERKREEMCWWPAVVISLVLYGSSDCAQHCGESRLYQDKI